MEALNILLGFSIVTGIAYGVYRFRLWHYHRRLKEYADREQSKKDILFDAYTGKENKKDLLL